MNTMEYQRSSGGATSEESQKSPVPAASTAVELPLPEELSRLLPDGEYLLESFIGQGGMGAVYRGVQMPSKRPVAVKILQRRHAGDEFHFEDRFRQEAYAMATLVHPNVVQVYDCGDAGEEFLFISMELVEGGDLSQAMRRGHQLALASALQLLVPICEGLQAAHEHGLVHRDIKPANILLTPDSKPKVADFGLAKRFDVQTTFVTQGGLGMGTPDYAAPEQYEEFADLDHRVDIYSLGVMFYQMLTGHLPRGIFKPASRLVQVDPRVDTVLQKAMQHDRAERYQSVMQLKVDLQHILATWMAPPRPRVVVQTGKVRVGTGILPTATSRVQSTVARAFTVNGSRYPMTNGNAQTVAKPVSSPPTTVFHRRPCCRATCAAKKRAHEAMLAGVLILAALGGAATIVATRHFSPTVSEAVEPAAPKHKKEVRSHAAGSVPATKQSLISTKNGIASSPSALLPLPVRPSLQTLDLLALTDPSKDDALPRGSAQKKGWVREGATLVYTGSGKPGKVVAPVALECLDYELEIRAERREGTTSLHVNLPLSTGKILPVVLNDPFRQILNEKEGPGWFRNATLVHALIRVVSKAGGTEDDRLVIYDVAAKTEIFTWQGRLASMGTPGESQAEFAGKRLTSLFLPRDSYIIRMWKLTIFEGKAVRLREPESAPQGNLSVVQTAPSFSASSSSGSASNPSEFMPLTKTDARLAKLESGFQQRRETDAQKPFVTAMANLNAGYIRALASARTTAEKQGNRSHLLLYDDEATRAKAGAPPPQSDAPGTPESLVKLRSTYRTEMAKYELVRNRADAALHDIYIGALDAYIEELARSNDARAREVSEVRRQIIAKKPVVPVLPSPQDANAGGRPLAPAH